MPDTPQYLSPPQFATRLGVSAETVRAMIRAGELGAVRIGVGRRRPRLRVPVSEIERLAE